MLAGWCIGLISWYQSRDTQSHRCVPEVLVTNQASVVIMLRVPHVLVGILKSQDQLPFLHQPTQPAPVSCICIRQVGAQKNPSLFSAQAFWCWEAKNFPSIEWIPAWVIQWMQPSRVGGISGKLSLIFNSVDPGESFLIRNARCVPRSAHVLNSSYHLIMI